MNSREILQFTTRPTRSRETGRQWIAQSLLRLGRGYPVDYFCRRSLGTLPEWEWLVAKAAGSSRVGLRVRIQNPIERAIAWQ